jgi:hypothetical protein
MFKIDYYIFKYFLASKMAVLTKICLMVIHFFTAYLKRRITSSPSDSHTVLHTLWNKQQEQEQQQQQEQQSTWRPSNNNISSATIEDIFILIDHWINALWKTLVLYGPGPAAHTSNRLIRSDLHIIDAKAITRCKVCIIIIKSAITYVYYRHHYSDLSLISSSSTWLGSSSLQFTQYQLVRRHLSCSSALPSARHKSVFAYPKQRATV